MNIIQHMDIPQNIYEFISSHNGCNLSININSTDAINGYGHIMWYSVHISMLTRTCNRCGYESAGKSGADGHDWRVWHGNQ